MDLSQLMAISQLPGLFKLKGNRSNGLIVEDLDSGKGRFCSSRRHQFTPLESIAIYTMEDTISLKDVFERILKKDPAQVPTEETSDDDLKAYFKELIPDYDDSRVHVKDMKKLFKWFRFLNERSLLDSTGEEEE